MTAVVPTDLPVGSDTRATEIGEDSASAQGVSPGRAALIVALIGVLITGGVAWTALTLNRQNEHRLLVVQTRQAAEVLSSTILSIRDPLQTALQVESVTGGSAQQFNQFADAYVGPGRLFVSAVLWNADRGSRSPIQVVGQKPLLNPDSPQSLALVHKALDSTTFVVTSVRADGVQRIGYAIANPKEPSMVVYAERAIPANRQVPVESESAFSDLNFATYLGPGIALSDLTTTDLPIGQLPIGGNSVHTSIPFGNSSVTLVTAPRGHLGGTLGGALPWIFLVGGLVLAAASAVVTYQLVRRRRSALRDAHTIAGLYKRLDVLYGEQRSIAETLQHALLPQRIPSVPNLEIASRYLAGADGVEIGGDWYSLIEIDQHHFAFAVGDVSGKGVDAAAIMARLRFTIRAYLTEGHAPDVVLEMCSRQLSVNRDGHLSTVLVGIGDVDSGVITMANAGHMDPLILSGSGAEFAHTPVGLPLGVVPAAYTPTTVRLASGSTLVAYTDGLVERRGEIIDIGMERLARTAAGSSPTLDDLLTVLISTLGSDGPDDDVAILAFRWTSPN
jgi:serine phosphatase RsbU (regulator of sigma subunit)